MRNPFSLKPEEFKIKMPVRNSRGVLIGNIEISSDGNFSGEFIPGAFPEFLHSAAGLGFTDGMLMEPIVIPAVESVSDE